MQEYWTAEIVESFVFRKIRGPKFDLLLAFEEDLARGSLGSSLLQYLKLKRSPESCSYFLLSFCKFA